MECYEISFCIGSIRFQWWKMYINANEFTFKSHMSLNWLQKWTHLSEKRRKKYRCILRRIIANIQNRKNWMKMSAIFDISRTFRDSFFPISIHLIWRVAIDLNLIEKYQWTIRWVFISLCISIRQITVLNVLNDNNNIYSLYMCNHKCGARRKNRHR